MADFIIIDGDQVNFLPSFGSAIIVPIPGTISGSGEATFNGKKVCIEGDEGSVEVANVPYIAPPYIGGMGTLKIVSLGSDQVAGHTNSGGKKVILKGSMFDAKLEVTSKGSDPVSGSPDPMSEYSGGKGMFINSNIKLNGT